ncbi:MAG: GTP 3',8-cyclase MoaA, partial [Tepidisphaeraceae bacterium]
MRLPLFEPRTPLVETGPRSIGAVQMSRISLTDRCNYRCVYCMPADGVPWLPKDDLLTFEEIGLIVRTAIEQHNIRRFKLTGGEPTVRRGLTDLVRQLRAIPGVEDLSLTTNGDLLEGLARPLSEAGLDRVTISIDSLRPERFKQVTRTGDLSAVLRGLDASLAAGFGSVKINCVMMRGVNDDELDAFARLSLERPLTVRFIEYMPLGDAAVMTAGTRVADDERGPQGGCGAQDRGDVFISEGEARERIEARLGALEPVARASEPGVGPAIPYRLAGAVGRIG